MARSDKRTACITIGGACFAIAAIAVTMITYPFWPETADPPTAVLPPAGAKDVYAANNGEGSENRIVELEGFPTPITDEEVQRLRLLLNPSYQQGLPNLRAIAARIFLSVVGGRKKGDDFVVLEDGLTDWERLRSIRENAPSRTRPGSTDAGTSDNKTKKKMEEAMELSEHLESMLWAIRESHYRERLAAHLFKLVVPYYTQAAKDVTVGENESRPRATAGVSSASPEHGDDNSARDQYEKQLSVAKTKSRIVGRYTDFLLRFVLRLTADTLPNEVQALVASADLPVHQSHCNASECTAHECSAHEACNAGGCNARECAPQQPREACTPAASSGDGARPQASAPLTVAHGVAPHIQHTSYACRMGTCSHNHDTTHVTSNARGPSQAELGAATSAATSTSPATSAAPVVATPAAIAPPASPVGALIWQQRPPLGRARVTSTTSPSFTPATSNIATPVPGHRSLISPGVPEYVDPKTGMMFALGNGLPVLPEQDHRIPVTIITGPLGAGKTTLLKSSILDSRLGLWVVENDLGEGNVDKSLLGEGEGWQITGVAGGCACCEKKDDLKSAVQALVLSGAHFSAIVIELSGAADPSRVQADLFGHGGVIDLRLRLDAVISVADTPVLLKQIAEHASEPKKLESLSRDAIENFVDLEAMRRVGNQWTDGLDDTGRNQIAHADRVFLNKVSDLTEADIQKVKDYLAAERIFRRDPSNLRVINRDVKDSKGLVPVDQLLGTDLRSKWAHEAVTNYNVPLLVLPAPTSCGGCADENCHSCTSNTESQTSTSQLPAPEGKAALSSDPRNISIAPDCTHLVPGQGEGVPSSVTQAYASEGHLQDRSTVRPPEALPGNRRGPPPAVLDDEAAAATPSTGNTSTLQLCKNYFTQNRCGQEHTGDCGHHHGARGTHPIVPVAGTACTVAGTACTDRRGTVPPPPPPPPPPPVPRPSRRRGSAASSSQHSSGDNGCPRCSSDSSCQPSPAMPSTASSCSPATSSVPIDNRSAPGSPSPISPMSSDRNPCSSGGCPHSHGSGCPHHHHSHHHDHPSISPMGSDRDPCSSGGCPHAHGSGCPHHHHSHHHDHPSISPMGSDRNPCSSGGCPHAHGSGCPRHHNHGHACGAGCTHDHGGHSTPIYLAIDLDRSQSATTSTSSTRTEHGGAASPPTPSGHLLQAPAPTTSSGAQAPGPRPTKEVIERLLQHPVVMEVAKAGLLLRMKGFVEDAAGKFWIVQGRRDKFDPLVEVPAQMKMANGHMQERKGQLVVIGRFLDKPKVERFIRNMLSIVS